MNEFWNIDAFEHDMPVYKGSVPDAPTQHSMIRSLESFEHVISSGKRSVLIEHQVVRNEEAEA